MGFKTRLKKGLNKMNEYNLKLSPYKVKLLIFILNKELENLDNINRKSELTELRNHLIALIQN